MSQSQASASAIWQNGSLQVKACRHGTMAFLSNDQYIGKSLDFYGEFSEGEAELFRQMIRPNWTVVEVGANMGAHTVLLSKLVGSQGVVHAYEPQRILFQVLCANLALNRCHNVHAHQAAVGREKGSLVVPYLDYNAVNNFGGLGLGEWNRGEAVSVETIDELSLPQCQFLKVDVEGMESEVIAGAENVLRTHRPLLYLENDRKEKSAGLIAQLLALDYRLYWHLPLMFNPQNFFGQAENIFGGIASLNMLGIHRSVPQDIQGMREITEPTDSWDQK